MGEPPPVSAARCSSSSFLWERGRIWFDLVKVLIPLSHEDWLTGCAHVINKYTFPWLCLIIWFVLSTGYACVFPIMMTQSHAYRLVHELIEERIKCMLMLPSVSQAAFFQLVHVLLYGIQVSWWWFEMILKTTGNTRRKILQWEFLFYVCFIKEKGKYFGDYETRWKLQSLYSFANYIDFKNYIFFYKN